MNREKYLQMRNALMTEAQNLLNEGKFEEMKAKKAEIEKLDSDFEAIATEQANLAALENKAVPYNPENSAVNPVGAKVVGTTEQDNSKVDYETVFAKVALKRQLNNAEIEVYNKYNPENAYTHNTTNTEIMIPETVILFYQCYFEIRNKREDYEKAQHIWEEQRRKAQELQECINFRSTENS